MKDDFIRALPKAELHIHVEGTLEPALVRDIARRNRAPSNPPPASSGEFTDLQSFLDVYYARASVLTTEEDFHDLARACLRRVRRDGVRHVEVFFDPQTHTGRGVPFETVIRGIHGGLAAGGEECGISTGLIMCFLRHLSADAALETFAEALPFRDRLVGVGLDSSEAGHPPAKFLEVFARARREGLRIVAHAGEEGPSEYVWQALDLLGAERIDHGIRSIEDPALVQRLARERIPLTICPLSNIKLGVCPSMAEHPLKRLLDAGVMVTINSDDPAYFGGYVADNYLAAAEALRLGREDIHQIAGNSFRASFLSETQKHALLGELDAYVGAR